MGDFTGSARREWEEVVEFLKKGDFYDVQHATAC